MNLSDHLQIGWHLLRREAIVFSRSWWSGILDSLIMSAVAVLTFGYFLPVMGMPAHFRLPMFIGSLMVSVLFFGYHVGGSLAIDLAVSKVWLYHASLPAPLWVMLSVQLISLATRIILFVVPAGAIGMFVIDRVAFLNTQWGALAVMMILTSMFFSLLFLWAVMFFKIDRFYTDLWPCVLAPMYSFGCIFFTWHSFAQLRPTIAKLLLWNPMTYCTEGLRGALLGGSESFPLMLCAVALAIFCILMFFLCRQATVVRINPVLQRSSK